MLKRKFPNEYEQDDDHDEWRVAANPWDGYEGTPPTPVAVNCNSNIGAWMRNNLIYLIDNLEQMAKLWQGYHNNIRTIHPNPNAPARGKFWSRRQQMIKEKDVIKEIAKEVRWSVTYLMNLHENRNSCQAHLNLQRRSMYLFILCIGALSDARCLNRADLYMHSDQGYARVNSSLMVRVRAGYGAGLSSPEKSANYVAFLHIYAPGIYDPNDERKQALVKLPRHFVDLLRRMYGDYFHIPPPLFRALLSRYMLFLAMIIWRPVFYDEVFRVNWHNYDYILDLNNTAPYALDVDYLNATLCQFSHHVRNSPPQNLTDDTRAVCPNPQNWQADWPGVSLEDVHGPTPNEDAFTQLLTYDFMTDTSHCQETDQGYWSRMMMIPAIGRRKR